MITNINEYEAETAFERFALDRYLPLTAQTSGSYIDIRPLIDGGKNVIQNGASHIQANREDSLRAAFLPLAFGAAWKVLDLTIELALAKQGIKPQREAKLWPIKEKARLAMSGTLNGVILTEETCTWEGMLTCYVSTIEYRHSLIHRQAQFVETPLTLSGYGRDGMPLPPLDEATLRALIALSQLIGEGIINNGLNRRRLDNVNFLLNRLLCFGVNSVPKGVRMKPIEYYWMKLRRNPHGQWVAPFSVVREQMRCRRQIGHIDVRIDLPGESGRQLVGQCEELPDRDVTIDFNQPPSYLAYQ